VKLNPYLNFNGNCEEAFRLYEKVLDGKITYIGRYKDMPGDHGLPPESVMHVTLLIGDQTLQGADSPPNQYQTPKGTAVALQIKDVAEAERVFTGLSEGGSVDMPLQETFWAARCGTARQGRPSE
jgi:PhnB protein